MYDVYDEHCRPKRYISQYFINHRDLKRSLIYCNEIKVDFADINIPKSVIVGIIMSQNLTSIGSSTIDR